ncbi:MAG: hypothetical protein ACUVTG_10745 [Candidatus Oleimicrobiaceae bacterium]
MAQSKHVVRGGLIALLLVAFHLPPRGNLPAVEANRIRGYTYYWNESRHAWRIAAGALVVVRRAGQQCAQTSSGADGYYFICLDTCRAPGSPPVVLSVEASYEGLHDYYSLTSSGQDEYHDFYMRVTEEENVPPDGK